MSEFSDVRAGRSRRPESVEDERERRDARGGSGTHVGVRTAAATRTQPCGGCPHSWRFHDDDGEYGCLVIDRRTRSGFCSCPVGREVTT